MVASISTSMAALSRIKNWAPILMLHEVVADDTAELPYGAVTQSGLRRILLDFIGRGYRSGTLDDLVGTDGGGQAAWGLRGTDKKCLVLTFDDGTCDFLEYALPVLQELDCTATLFIVAGKIGGKRDWLSNHDGPPMAAAPLMNAEQLRELHRMGFAIGSHTYSHCRMTAAGQEELKREVTLSRDALADLIGERIDWFAYPYLAGDRREREAVREAGYKGACGGPNRRHELYYLNRVDASAFSLPKLRLRCSGLFHITRQLAREARGKTRSA